MRAPHPKPNESRDKFIVRCHNELMGDVTDTDERNRVCFLAWSKETEVEKIASQEFPTDKYEHVRDVPIFAEHEKPNKKGELQKYDRRALQAIADSCNRRILDTKNFARLSDGHTPEPEEVRRGARQPDVLGYVGTFHLGMIGKLKPRWAIFADEYRYKDTAAQTARKPGRSVEVWMHKNITDRIFDPIAALGAETPQLDLPMKFSRTPSGIEVAKYSAFYAQDKNMLSTVEMNTLAENLVPVLQAELMQQLQAALSGQQAGKPPVERYDEDADETLDPDAEDLEDIHADAEKFVAAERKAGRKANWKDGVEHATAKARFSMRSYNRAVERYHRSSTKKTVERYDQQPEKARYSKMGHTQAASLIDAATEEVLQRRQRGERGVTFQQVLNQKCRENGIEMR